MPLKTIEKLVNLKDNLRPCLLLLIPESGGKHLLEMIIMASRGYVNGSFKPRCPSNAQG
jgi:hypothetical protein